MKSTESIKRAETIRRSVRDNPKITNEQLIAECARQGIRLSPEFAADRRLAELLEMELLAMELEPQESESDGF